MKQSTSFSAIRPFTPTVFLGAVLLGWFINSSQPLKVIGVTSAAISFYSNAAVRFSRMAHDGPEIESLVFADLTFDTATNRKGRNVIHKHSISHAYFGKRWANRFSR